MQHPVSALYTPPIPPGPEQGSYDELLELDEDELEELELELGEDDWPECELWCDE